MSQLRALLGGRLESRPYRIGLDVRCDVTDVLHRLRAGDVAGATERYGGELLPGSESPALVEFGTLRHGRGAQRAAGRSSSGRGAAVSGADPI